MARRDPFDELTEEWEPKLRQAFLDSISEITDNVRLNEITRLLERGDIEGVLRYLGIDRLKFQGLSMAIGDVYTAGGLRFASAIPSLVRFIFDTRNLRAEQWIREHSSRLISEIVEDQREMIRTHLVDGLARGDNPRTTARSVVGTINKATGKREGGVIGLTSAQERTQAKYAQLISSSDPKDLREALKKGLRDRRFDRSVLKAIREGKPIPKGIQAKMVAAYRNKTLKYRADVISRTETLQSLAASEHEAYRQAIARGELEEDQVIKEWDSAGDTRVRFSHNVLNGQRKKFNEPFRSPLGSRMQYPGDTSQNARKGDIIQCRCKLKYKVKFR